MTQQQLPDDRQQQGSSPIPRTTRRVPQTRQPSERCPPEGSRHLLFGSVEELLADLTASGGPEGGIVRVERLVRTQPNTLGGVATFGVAVTAQRASELSEVLSAWVIVARVTLDLQGQPLAPAQAQAAARRHHDAQRLISALVADAGYTPRSGVYLLSDGCYTFTATAEPLAASDQRTATTKPSADSRGPSVEGERGDEGGDKGGTTHA